MEIEIVGRHALLFDDDTTAAFVNSQDALVEWNSLQIDRYDVRHLLFSPPPSRRRRNPQTSHSSSADAEIDYERYLDLPSPSEEEEADAKPEPVDGFNAVPFSYGNYEDSNDQKNAEPEPEGPGFHPSFPVPDNLVQNLPPTEKVHQIIARTALFVSKNGGQSEIVLRVKQGDNPTFGFLMPDHHLHPYFRFLVNHKDLLQSNGEKPSNIENTAGAGALSLLGSIYGTGEDDDVDESGKPTLPSGKEDAPILIKNPLPNPLKAARTSSIRKGDSLNSVSGVRASSLPPIHKTEHMIMDPPSDMKRLVDKIVEFIIKNGRQFETVLMEQDRDHGRFPFLIPSNKFHSYYLKVLQGAHELKLTVKSLKNEKEDYRGHGYNKKRETENSLMESDDIPIDSDRKEKFKMVINKSKKEDIASKATEPPPGVQVDAAQAAAILQAATRGIKHSNLAILPLTEEQRLKAERLKRAKMFVAQLKSGAETLKAEPSRGLSAEPQVLGADDNTLNKKVKSEKEHLDEERRAKRKYRARFSRDEEEEEDDESERKRSSKKKHRSHESEERYRKRYHTSHKHDDDEDDKRKRKKKKKHRYEDDEESDEEYSRRSDDEHSRRKHRSHRHKHRKSESSRHKHKHGSNPEDGEMSSKGGNVVVDREASVDVSSSYQDSRPPPQPIETTEVPDDLRAKIRAMLMSTM